MAHRIVAVLMVFLALFLSGCSAAPAGTSGDLGSSEEAAGLSPAKDIEQYLYSNIPDDDLALLMEEDGIEAYIYKGKAVISFRVFMDLLIPQVADALIPYVKDAVAESGVDLDTVSFQSYRKTADGMDTSTLVSWKVRDDYSNGLFISVPDNVHKVNFTLADLYEYYDLEPVEIGG